MGVAHDQKFWDKLFETYNSEIFDVRKSDRKKIIESWINEVASNKKSVADIGCAIGKWLPMLSGKFKQVSAIDFSPAIQNDNKVRFRSLKNVDFHITDMTRPLRNATKYDVVFCVNAILNPEEHKRNIFFNNISACVKKNGQLILVVPSFENAIYSEFVIEKCKEKAGKKIKRPGGSITNAEFVNFKRGAVPIDNAPTKHYSKEELIFTLHALGFKVLDVEKVEYDWNTEMNNPPKWLKDPYPWDWVLRAVKN